MDKPSIDRALETASTSRDGEFALSALTGEVTGEKVWSESRTTGGGGGGVVVKGFGVSNSGKVRTTVTNKREFWLKAEDGREEQFVTIMEKVAVRDGQTVTALTVERPGKRGVCAFYNHATGTLHAVDRVPAHGWETTLALGSVFMTPLALFLLFGGVSPGIGILLLAGNVYWKRHFAQNAALKRMMDGAEAILRAERAAPSAPAVPLAPPTAGAVSLAA